MPSMHVRALPLTSTGFVGQSKILTSETSLENFVAEEGDAFSQRFVLWFFSHEVPYLLSALKILKFLI